MKGSSNLSARHPIYPVKPGVAAAHKRCTGSTVAWQRAAGGSMKIAIIDAGFRLHHNAGSLVPIVMTPL